MRAEERKGKESAKSEAKQARRENEILHQKATRNDVKYAKNKDFQKQLAVDFERLKIRREAVRQAEELAGKHDRSGKLFGVSEIVENGKDGRVTTREGRERKEAEKSWEDSVQGEQWNKKVKRRRREEWLLEQKEFVKPVIPAGYSVKEGEEDYLKLWDITDQQIKIRMNKTKGEKKKDGNMGSEENMKKQKLGKKLRQMKKEAEKKGLGFDRKAAQRQLAEKESSVNANELDGASDSSSDSEEEDGGVAIDSHVKQSEEILGSLKEREAEELQINDKQKKADKKAAKAARKRAKEDDKVEASSKDEAKSVTDTSKKRKHSETHEAVGEEQSKKSKKTKKASKELSPESNGTKDLLESNDAKLDALIAQGNKAREAEITESATKYTTNMAPHSAPAVDHEQEDEEMHKAEKTTKSKKEKKQKKEKKAEKSKKSKKIKGAPEPSNEALEKQALEAAKAAQAEREAAEAAALEKKKEKKRKEKKSHTDENSRVGDNSQPPQAQVASQWGAASLGGGNARQDKFLRLLGAGKNSSLGGSAQRGSVASGNGKIDVGKMQSDLERQFEEGNMRKHDGGSKRRGLGA